MVEGDPATGLGVHRDGRSLAHRCSWAGRGQRSSNVNRVVTQVTRPGDCAHDPPPSSPDSCWRARLPGRPVDERDFALRLIVAGLDGGAHQRVHLVLPTATAEHAVMSDAGLQVVVLLEWPDARADPGRRASGRSSRRRRRRFSIVSGARAADRRGRPRRSQLRVPCASANPGTPTAPSPGRTRPPGRAPSEVLVVEGLGDGRAGSSPSISGR